jgi:hypothetical protein
VLRRVTPATPHGNPGCLPLSNPTKCRKLGLRHSNKATRYEDEDSCAAAEALREQQHIAAMQKQQASGTEELSAKLDTATLARVAALKVVKEKIPKLAPDDYSCFCSLTQIGCSH